VEQWHAVGSKRQNHFFFPFCSLLLMISVVLFMQVFACTAKGDVDNIRKLKTHGAGLEVQLSSLDNISS
jgi:hypothetical protein